MRVRLGDLGMSGEVSKRAGLACLVSLNLTYGEGRTLGEEGAVHLARNREEGVWTQIQVAWAYCLGSLGEGAEACQQSLGVEAG